MDFNGDVAWGAPGIPPRWTSSAKEGVGAAVSGRSRVWFAISHGIVNEVYYPRLDQANIRDFGLLVGDPHGFFSEEKRHTDTTIRMVEPGVPAFEIENACQQGNYTTRKTILADPRRDALLHKVQLEVHKNPPPSGPGPFTLYALISPHVNNRGWGNSAWCDQYKGHDVLYAEGQETVLAVMATGGFPMMNAGYVGFSDSWQDISKHGRMTSTYRSAPDGNVALTGELSLDESGSCVIAIGFGRSPQEAAQVALASLTEDFDTVLAEYVRQWKAFQDVARPLEKSVPARFYRESIAVLRAHEDVQFPGAMIASMSIPWGFNKGDDDLGGYHLVWPRDLVETAIASLAAGDAENARQTLHYLICTQEADGHWPQNMWLNGEPYWHGIQLDEVGFPILLAATVLRTEGWNGTPLWPMVRSAAAFMVSHGPATDQDRWEEDGGFSPFSLAVAIAALLAAADIADQEQESGIASYLRECADLWNLNIERWTYATGTELCEQAGIEGYYVRIVPKDTPEHCPTKRAVIQIKNRGGSDSEPVTHVISPDALALVRFGLRDANDPKIRNTIQVIDRILKKETRNGPVWYRYNGDGYGEHADGAPYDGSGIGRGWPLLAGERAHYELAAGNHDTAVHLLQTMEAQAGTGGLFPEQTWDADDIEDRELFNGRPAGSAMPLVWAHSEYIKLIRSLADGKVFDMPPQTTARYLQQTPPDSPFTLWRPTIQCRAMPQGRTLRIELPNEAMVVWTPDDWKSTQKTKATDLGLGVYVADLDTKEIPAGGRVEFTFHWEDDGNWEGSNYTVSVEHPDNLQWTRAAG